MYAELFINGILGITPCYDLEKHTEISEKISWISGGVTFLSSYGVEILISSLTGHGSPNSEITIICNFMGSFVVGLIVRYLTADPEYRRIARNRLYNAMVNLGETKLDKWEYQETRHYSNGYYKYSTHACHRA